MLRYTLCGLAGALVHMVSTYACAQPAAEPQAEPRKGRSPYYYPDELPMLQYIVRPGAEACPPERALRIEVALARFTTRDELLPYDVYDDERVVVRVTLEKVGSKFRGTLEHMPPRGRPVAPSIVHVNSECPDVVRDLAFPASSFLPLHPEPVCTAPAKQAPPEPPPAPPLPAPAPPALPAPPPPGRPGCDPDKEGDAKNDEACERLLEELGKKYRRRVDFSLLGGGIMTLAYTSDPGPGVLIGAAIQGKHWSVALEAQATLPAPVRVAPELGLDQDVSSFVGLVVPCVRLGETVVFVGCGVVGGGAYITHDSQAKASQQTLIFETIRIGPRAGLEVPLGDRFAFFASGEVSFAPITPKLTYGDVYSWTQSAASVFLYAGFSARLGRW